MMRRFVFASLAMSVVVGVVAGCLDGGSARMLSEDECHAEGGTVAMNGGGLVCETRDSGAVAIRAASGKPVYRSGVMSKGECDAAGGAVSLVEGDLACRVESGDYVRLKATFRPGAMAEHECDAAGGTVSMVEGALACRIVSGYYVRVSSAACPFDRRTGKTSGRVYRDALGDAEGPGDIGTIRVSDRDGIVTVSITVTNFGTEDPNLGSAYQDVVFVELDANCAGDDAFAFAIGSDGDGSWSRVVKDDIGFPSSMPVTQSGDTYTFRLDAADFDHIRAFRLSARTIDYDPTFAPFGSDQAPGRVDSHSTWEYDLTSR